jgi:hypothetical protein
VKAESADRHDCVKTFLCRNVGRNLLVNETPLWLRVAETAGAGGPIELASVGSRPPLSSVPVKWTTTVHAAARVQYCPPVTVEFVSKHRSSSTLHVATVRKGNLCLSSGRFRKSVHTRLIQ